MLVHRTKGFVTDFMIDEHKFTKVRTISIINHDLPPATGFGGFSRP